MAISFKELFNLLHNLRTGSLCCSCCKGHRNCQAAFHDFTRFTDRHIYQRRRYIYGNKFRIFTGVTMVVRTLIHLTSPDFQSAVIMLALVFVARRRRQVSADDVCNLFAGADEIATASHMLAESSTVQAAAAQSLSDEMKHVSELIHFNDEQAQSAYEITKAIEADLKTSDEHMKVLYDSVIQMRDASKKISSVMKAIDDITFETNILALNAAIEAARAGAAGKGFAVVADEVRALAMKSAEAAQESHRLIENSIKQTEHGSNLATESAAIFEGIHKKIAQIVEIVEKVSGLSTDQMQSIQQVANSVSQITEAATRNAAISEESDASSQEMRNQAAFLRDKMKHFNLRKREKGKAYIPDEKQYDSEFIEYANKAYHLKETTGHYGNEYIDPSGRDTETV